MVVVVYYGAELRVETSFAIVFCRWWGCPAAFGAVSPSVFGLEWCLALVRGSPFVFGLGRCLSLGRGSGSEPVLMLCAPSLRSNGAHSIVW